MRLSSTDCQLDGGNSIDDFLIQGCVVIALPDEIAQGSSIDSKQFIESNDRDVVVAYSYSQGISRQYTLHDDPTYFIGWEVVSTEAFSQNWIHSIVHNQSITLGAGPH